MLFTSCPGRKRTDPGRRQREGKARSCTSVQPALASWMLLLDVFVKQKLLRGLAHVVCALQIFVPTLSHMIFNFLLILGLVDVNL
jgi:hypothetical protein